MKFDDYLKQGNRTFYYGALWSYSPRGVSREERLSQDYRNAVKYQRPIQVEGKQVFMPEHIADTIAARKAALPFMKFFKDDPIVVPVTRSTLMKPDTLWVPRLIATALHEKGFGSMVSPSLERIYAVPDHASAREHFDSQVVRQKLLSEPEHIVLIDDFVTSGKTMAGSALRLIDTYPNVRVDCFAAIRTESLSKNFKRIDDPVCKTITLYSSEKTFREPF